MGQKLSTRLYELAPWRDDVSWQFNGVQGVVALGIGVYLFFATTHAVGTLVQIVGAYIAGMAIMHLGLAIWDPSGLSARPTGLLRRAISLIAGAAALLFPWLGFLSTSDARFIITAALVISGVIAIVGALTDRRLREVRWGSSLSGVVEIAIGVVFFVVTDSERPLLNWLGVALLVAGLILIGRALLRSGVLDGNTP